MNKSLAFLILLSSSLTIGSLPYGNEQYVFAQMIDERDGAIYQTVAIGSQIWLAENLRFVAPESECYDGIDSLCERFGRLYSFSDSRIACPDGWHLPTKKEWKRLRSRMRTKKAQSIIAPEFWEDDRFEGATNSLGLSILPAGRKDELGSPDRPSMFGEMGMSSSFWLDDSEYHWHIRWGKSHIHKHGDISQQRRKFSIRCVCDTLHP